VKLAVGIPLRHPWDYEVAARPIAGRPWIVRLQQRLMRARTVERVIALSWARCEGSVLEALAHNGEIELRQAGADDALAAMQPFADGIGGVALCPVTQLFADPERLDALAGLADGTACGRASWVAHYDTNLPLAGGAFLDIHVRAAAAGQEAAAFPSWPEAPEARLETPADFDWAALACAHLLDAEADGAMARFEEVIEQADLGRFVFWDRIGPRPRRILTVRCVSTPLFERLLRYLNRIRSARVDVVCSTSLLAHTQALGGVSRAIGYDGPRFSIDALPGAVLGDLRAAHYDLCVVPCLSAGGARFENVLALGQASAARFTIWMNPLGQCGQVWGEPQSWDETIALPGPSTWAPRLEAMGTKAMARFARARRLTGPAMPRQATAEIMRG
jgi:hypothetical protein